MRISLNGAWFPRACFKDFNFTGGLTPACSAGGTTPLARGQLPQHFSFQFNFGERPFANTAVPTGYRPVHQWLLAEQARLKVLKGEGRKGGNGNEVDALRGGDGGGDGVAAAAAAVAAAAATAAAAASTAGDRAKWATEKIQKSDKLGLIADILGIVGDSEAKAAGVARALGLKQ